MGSLDGLVDLPADAEIVGSDDQALGLQLGASRLQVVCGPAVKPPRPGAP